MSIEIVRTKTRLQELLADPRGFIYSDTWYKLHPRRCGSAKQLIPTESPLYDFVAGERYKSGLNRGVVVYFSGSFEETAAELDRRRNYAPDDRWTLCKSCEKLTG